MYLIDDVLNMWCYVMLIPVRFGPNNKHIILFVKGIFALSYKNNTASGKNQAAPTAGNCVCDPWRVTNCYNKSSVERNPVCTKADAWYVLWWDVGQWKGCIFIEGSLLPGAQEALLPHERPFPLFQFQDKRFCCILPGHA